MFRFMGLLFYFTNVLRENKKTKQKKNIRKYEEHNRLNKTEKHNQLNM